MKVDTKQQGFHLGPGGLRRIFVSVYIVCVTIGRLANFIVGFRVA